MGKPTQAHRALQNTAIVVESDSHLNVDTGGRVILHYQLLKGGRGGAHSLDIDTAESGLCVAQRVFGHQPHCIQTLVGQPAHQTVGVGERLQSTQNLRTNTVS